MKRGERRRHLLEVDQIHDPTSTVTHPVQWRLLYQKHLSL
jgi:hypothetical protein